MIRTVTRGTVGLGWKRIDVGGAERHSANEYSVLLTQSLTAGSLCQPPYILDMKRYLVQLPQDSADLDLVRAYCAQHSIDCRNEVFHMDTKEFVFTVIYTTDSKYISWLELQYPNSLFAF